MEAIKFKSSSNHEKSDRSIIFTHIANFAFIFHLLSGTSRLWNSHSCIYTVMLNYCQDCKFLLNERLLLNSHNYYCCSDVCSDVIVTSWWLVLKYHLLTMLISGSLNIVSWFVFLVGNCFLSAFINIEVDIVCSGWQVTYSLQINLIPLKSNINIQNMLHLFLIGEYGPLNIGNYKTATVFHQR